MKSAARHCQAASTIGIGLDVVVLQPAGCLSPRVTVMVRSARNQPEVDAVPQCSKKAGLASISIV